MTIDDEEPSENERMIERNTRWLFNVNRTLAEVVVSLNTVGVALNTTVDALEAVGIELKLLREELQKDAPEDGARPDLPYRGGGAMIVRGIAALVAAVTIPIAALALPAVTAAQAQTLGVEPSPLTCASGLAALGYRPNPYASPEQEQQAAVQYLLFQQRLWNEQVDEYFANAPSLPRSLAMLPFSMQDVVYLVVDTSRACSVPVTPPASLSSGSANSSVGQ
jgi:hypothetical protein